MKSYISKFVYADAVPDLPLSVERGHYRKPGAFGPWGNHSAHIGASIKLELPTSVSLGNSQLRKTIHQLEHS